MEPKDDMAGRGPGRPRVWASEAERKRAYRARLAVDLAEPARLRQELRDARKRIIQLERAVAGLQRDLARSGRAHERAVTQRDQALARVEQLRQENRDLWARLSGGMW
jgi:uncharacterized protein YhaN